jgi:hypothetical protein
MNFNTMQNLLTIAAVPVVDLDTPLPIEVTTTGRQNNQIRRWKDGKYWAVYDETGELICIAVYKKGAQEVVRRIAGK